MRDGMAAVAVGCSNTPELTVSAALRSLHLDATVTPTAGSEVHKRSTSLAGLNRRKGHRMPVACGDGLTDPIRCSPKVRKIV